jgi:hypothetical protein
MKKSVLLALLPIAILSGCGDGVPDVDPQHIVVKGEPMTGVAFMQKYCAGKSSNETCLKVSKAILAGSVRGRMPAGY